jgi:hypothetical protein
MDYLSRSPVKYYELNPKSFHLSGSPYRIEQYNTQNQHFVPQLQVPMVYMPAAHNNPGAQLRYYSPSNSGEGTKRSNSSTFSKHQSPRVQHHLKYSQYMPPNHGMITVTTTISPF